MENGETHINERDCIPRRVRKYSCPSIAPLPKPVPAVEEQESKLHRSQQIRDQYCVMLGAHGKPLNNCETVLHILRAMFDMLVSKCQCSVSLSLRSMFAAHRAMCEQDVLHRDIIWGNVLVYPVYDTEPANPGGSKDGRYTGIAPAFCTPPFFGWMTFSLTYHSNSGEGSLHPKSLLADLDQASRSNGKSPKSTERRQERTVSGSSGVST